MSIIIFIVILSVLVFVHELGHFLVAKKAGVKVEEFGFGYPPRALTLGYKWGTRFSLNWIPFGGFVKILGEDETQPPSHKSPDSIKFFEVSKFWQAAILAAGVKFNIIFAWILLSVAFMIGVPTPIDNDLALPISNPTLTVIGVLPGSPGEKANLKSGDKVLELKNENRTIVPDAPEVMMDFIQNSNGIVDFKILRNGETLNIEVVPDYHDILGQDRKVTGVYLDMVGIAKLSFFDSWWAGAKATLLFITNIFFGLVGLVKNIFIGSADFSQISGPIGIVGLVGEAGRFGLAYLLTFTAVISINLAIINLVPFPALDGGRLLFVGIEAVTRKKIPSNIFMILNTVGFFLLIALMIFVTIQDALKLF